MGMINYKEYKLLAVIVLVIAVPSSGIINSAFASNTKLNVDCKALALALITWDQLVAISNDDDIAENEHVLNDEHIEPDLYTNIVDDYLKPLLEQVNDGCTNYDDEVEELLDEISLELPF